MIGDNTFMNNEAEEVRPSPPPDSDQVYKLNMSYARRSLERATRAKAAGDISLFKHRAAYQQAGRLPEDKPPASPTSSPTTAKAESPEAPKVN